MRITWVRQVKPQKKDAKEKADAVAVKKANQTATSGLGDTAKAEEEESKFVFTVVPDTVVLNPKMGIMIEFRANSSQTGRMSEPWQCQAIIGNDRKPKPVWTSNVTANFITPILQFNDPKIDFKYLWQKGVPSAPITQEL
jgi:hydrocephalus-inducing protein